MLRWLVLQNFLVFSPFNQLYTKIVREWNRFDKWRYGDKVSVWIHQSLISLIKTMAFGVFLEIFVHFARIFHLLFYTRDERDWMVHWNFDVTKFSNNCVMFQSMLKMTNARTFVCFSMNFYRYPEWKNIGSRQNR